MTIRALGLLSALCLGPTMLAQVGVDHPVRFIGPAATDRQLTGLPNDPSSSSAINARTEQSNAHRTASVGSGNSWDATVPALTGAPSPGTHLVVLVPSAVSDGEIALTVNQAGPYPVILRPSVPLDGATLAPGAALSLVFDGTAFQVMAGIDHHRRDCADGLTAVNDQFCIEPDERAANTFFEAARACTESGLRLCTWTEWYNACALRISLGLQNMTGNWEYTDDTANEDGYVRAVGNSSCTQGTTWSATATPITFRCCYSR